MTGEKDIKEVLKQRILATERQRSSSLNRTRKPNKRLENLARWLVHGERPASGNVQQIATAADRIASNPLDKSDPRERIITLDARWSGVLAQVANKNGLRATVTPWSRRIVQESLNRVYRSLAEAMGAPNALTHQTKDVNIGRLFDMANSQDLGFTLRQPTGESLKLDNPSELAMFMDHLLSSTNTRHVAKVIFSSVTTLENLRRYPEDHKLSSLLRVLDQFNIEMEAYDKRPVLTATAARP